uniref:SFRICE_030434 n=1 Tax=Spodoptera frugiperda TaxID=7108 RepID=A0A2H1WFD6_SPOFR
MTSQISCIAHMKFTCELRRIENPNEQQLGSKPARHDHLAWSEDPPFLRELYSLFPKGPPTPRAKILWRPLEGSNIKCY